jgi:glycerol uptake facilitator-like aquaporin
VRVVTPQRKLVAEALGTALLVAAVVGSGIMAQRLTADRAICRGDPAESARWHATLLATSEEVLRELEIPTGSSSAAPATWAWARCA